MKQEKDQEKKQPARDFRGPRVKLSGKGTYTPPPEKPTENERESVNDGE